MMLSAPPGAPAAHRRLVAACCLVYFTLAYALAVQWFHRGYFDVFNIFFDADPNTNLASFAHGWWGGRNAPTHPLLELVSLPALWVGGLASLAGAGAEAVSRVREYVGLAYTPACAALSIAVFHRTLSRLHLAPRDALLATAVFALSFSSLLFAVVVESYAFSGLLIAVLLHWYVVCRQAGRGHHGVWFLLAVALAGVTITNVAVAGIAYLFFLRCVEQRSWPAALWRSALYGATALLLVLSVYAGLLQLLGVQAGVEGGARWVGQHASSSVYRYVANMINLLCAGFSTYVVVLPFYWEGKISVARGARDWPLIAAILVLALVLALSVRRRMPRMGWGELPWLLGAMLAFHALLHGFFGYEMLLYSLHWLAPLTLMLVPVMVHHRRITLALLPVMVLANLHFMLGVGELMRAA
ncbi:hypothetical protein [Hydrogenophaga sp.]|uniref:hypothetical protein n=1 Tax=Hydrogenophaga sp. TaxID=1904254 RepID=UPI00260FB7EF|nr:hypothetical protein [Hydrogenophaga sp.]MCW5652286.1 hypothetical protein [Hydrogenophaga sp.]